MRLPGSAAIGVSVRPRAIALMCTPAPAYSWAAERVSPWAACFDVA